MSDDLIRRQDAIDAIYERIRQIGYENNPLVLSIRQAIRDLPSAQPETSRIENALHGKSAEEQYDFLRWLMQDYGMQVTDTRTAVIEWLRGECNG